MLLDSSTALMTTPTTAAMSDHTSRVPALLHAAPRLRRTLGDSPRKAPRVAELGELPVALAGDPVGLVVRKVDVLPLVADPLYLLGFEEAVGPAKPRAEVDDPGEAADQRKEQQPRVVHQHRQAPLREP